VQYGGWGFQSKIDQNNIEKLESENSDVDALRAWAATHNVSTTFPDACRVLPELDKATQWPIGFGDPMTVISWPPPATELASKILAGLENKDRDEHKVGGKKELLEFWAERCKGFLWENCAKVDVPVDRFTICYFANKCLCQSPQGRNCMRFVKSLASRLCGRGGVLAKGTQARGLFTAAQAVLRVFREGRQMTLREHDTWVHLSYGNLVNGIFYVLVLKTYEYTRLGDRHQLSLLAEVKPQTWWGAFEDVNVEKDYDGEIWRLSERDEVLPVFEPRRFDVERVVDMLPFPVWRVKPPVRPPGPRTPQDGDRVPLPPEHDPPPPIEDWYIEAWVPKSGPNSLHERTNKASRVVRLMKKQCKNAEAERSPKRQRQRHPILRDWEPPDSSSSSSDSGDGGHRPRPPSPTPPPITPPVIPPLPPPSVPPPPPPPVEPRRQRPSTRDEDDKMPWLTVETPDAIFVLNPYSYSIGCRCLRHGATCRPNRSAEKQPVGYFAAWLAVAALPQYDSRATHFAARTDRLGDDAVMSYANRVKYRDLWKDNPLYSTLFSWEIQQTSVEPRDL